MYMAHSFSMGIYCSKFSTVVWDSGNDKGWGWGLSKVVGFNKIVKVLLISSHNAYTSVLYTG